MPATMKAAGARTRMNGGTRAYLAKRTPALSQAGLRGVSAPMPSKTTKRHALPPTALATRARCVAG
eukprot:6529325-Prymnesium_polylepis.1